MILKGREKASLFLSGFLLKNILEFLSGVRGKTDELKPNIEAGVFVWRKFIYPCDTGSGYDSLSVREKEFYLQLVIFSELLVAIDPNTYRANVKN